LEGDRWWRCAARARLGRREVEDDLTGGPHLSAAGREGARARRLGPTWAERGKEREKER
jgi:hypothetical protein